jgi:deoxyribodipyrimidine photo-lyase
MKVNLFWFRRDLRLHDNAGFYHALKSDFPVLPIFIFDKQILDKLENKEDARVGFLQNTVSEMSAELKELGSSILIKYGNPEEIWQDLLSNYEVQNVYTNHDFESYAIKRDTSIKKMLEQRKIGFHPYVVFTPYSKIWRAKLEQKSWAFINEKGEEITASYYFAPYPNQKYFGNLLATKPFEIPTLNDLGFQETAIKIPSIAVTRGVIKNYDKNRDFPAINGTSKLGIHFRHGTISIREKARKAQQLNATYLSELIWRDFYSQILHHFPHVEKAPFRAKYEAIEWRNNEVEFKAWCEGKTGYPMVDAGMRELNETGHMHNRVRMVVASFLTKHLMINWQWGEAYFAEKLLDFDLASNNGGWQWAAGCGTDAAPYFRIFNPESQLKKFDKELKYVKHWVKEYGTNAYPEPIVDHKMARARCLATYKEALN